MKKFIFTAILAASVGFGIGYAIFGGRPVEQIPEMRPEASPAAADVIMPATRPLFSAEVCRQSVDFLNGRMEVAKTSADRNLYAIAAATLREAELFTLFESKLQEMPIDERSAVIKKEVEWQKFYQEEMFRPLRNEGGSAAALESSLRSSALIFDRILYWTCDRESRSSYDALKELSFTDRFAAAPCEIKLHQGNAWQGTTRYQLLPGITCGDAAVGCGLVLNGEGNRQLICWRDGKMVKSVRLPGMMELFQLSFNPDRTAVLAEYMVNGKRSAKPLTVNF